MLVPCAAVISPVVADLDRRRISIKEVRDWLPIQPGKVAELDDVNPPVATLRFRHERLTLLEASRHLDLSKPSIGSGGFQAPEEPLIAGRSGGCHGHELNVPSVVEYSIIEYSEID